MNIKKCKVLFWVLATVIFVIYILQGIQGSATGDSFWDGAHGKYALKYYTEGDTTILDYEKHPNAVIPGMTSNIGSHMRLYGVGFDIVPAILIKYFDLEFYEIEIRAILCALFGFLLLLFTGLTGKRLGGWKVACLALVIAFFTPVVFGWSLHLQKDTPVAAGAAIALYGFLGIFEKLPDFKIKYIITAILGIAVAVSIRLSVGLIVIFYYVAGCFIFLILNKDFRIKIRRSRILLLKSVAISAVICITGLLLGLCFYPYFFEVGPIKIITDTFALAGDFFHNPPVFWNGKFSRLLDMPQSVDITSYLITIPLWVFLGIILLGIDGIKNIKRPNFKILFTVFTFLFPVLYVYFQETRFTGWGHTLFVYASIAALAASGFIVAGGWIKNRWYGIFFSAVVFVCMLPTVIWQIKNFNNASSYYNILAGNPYYKYDRGFTEYSELRCLKWLLKNEITDTNKIYRVMCKNILSKQYAESKKIKHLEVIEGGIRAFASADCDYALCSMTFAPLNVRKGWFPPNGVVYSEKVDGKPIAVAVKKCQSDALGIRLIWQQDYAKGLQELEKSYAFDSRNFGLWYYMGIGYYHTGQYHKAIEFLSKYYGFWSQPDEQSYCLAYIGASYVALKEWSSAIDMLQRASAINSGSRQNILPFIQYNMQIAISNKQK
ncbi:MAG: hypothetical protein LBG17_04040 [Bacteroidales bacterium]|jgi:tetratricopeptide (TPR) repeat protein|nr:hypothetical protein [Bacteroidales bacterium]